MSVDVEFVAPPTDDSRQFDLTRPVRLADTGPDGRMRPDAVARLLQDVATDDWAATGVVAEETWLVRRTMLRLSQRGRWPELGERVTATTWCGGSGPAWAERRTDLALGGVTVIETVALWVPVGRSGLPVRIGQDFLAAYGPSARRRVSGRAPTDPVDPHATRSPWRVRRSDLDVVGHANNAALWAPLAEVVEGSLRFAQVTYVGSVEVGDDLELAVGADRWWLVAPDGVRVAGRYELETGSGAARREDASREHEGESQQDPHR